MHCCGCRKLFATAGVLSSPNIHGVALNSGVVSLRSRVRACSSLPAARTFVVTLERSATDDSDEALWKSGVFAAEVYPDLSPARTIVDLLRFYLRRALLYRGTSKISGGVGWEQSVGVSDSPASTNPLLAEDREGAGFLVRTVPVQVSRIKELRQRLQAAAGVDDNGVAIEGHRPADALLLLSGSHPGRRLPLMRHFLPDANDELRLATTMRDSGHLPKRLAFWAVANPMVEAHEAGVDKVRKKVELGAEVILTQPPLVWEPFERWLRGVHASGALTRGAMAGYEGEARAGEHATATATASTTSRAAFERRRPSRTPTAVGREGGAAILVGMPVITSPKGLRFWLELCGVGDNPVLCTRAFEAFGGDSTNSGQPQALEEEKESKAGRTASAARAALGLNVGKSTSAASSGKMVGSSQPYGEDWFETTLSKLKSLGDSGLGVAGMHVMAPGPGPRRRASELASRGVFGGVVQAGVKDGGDLDAF